MGIENEKTKFASLEEFLDELDSWGILNYFAFVDISKVRINGERLPSEVVIAAGTMKRGAATLSDWHERARARWTVESFQADASDVVSGT